MALQKKKKSENISSMIHIFSLFQLQNLFHHCCEAIRCTANHFLWKHVHVANTADFSASLLFLAFSMEMANFQRESNMDGKLSCQLRAARLCSGQRQCTVCVCHISRKPEVCKNVSRAFRVLLTKTLIQHQPKDYNYVFFLFCMFVCCVCGCLSGRSLCRTGPGLWLSVADYM